MIAIIKREIQSFFGSPVGYLVIGLFLVANGLFLWVFPANYNIFDSGFADLSPYFELAPWVLLFLIPAITMRSFSEERKMETLELLLTKPISIRSIVGGKYAGALILAILAIIPTLLYLLTIHNLGNPVGNWDHGSTFGSFIGLLFLSATFTAIGVNASVFTKNQVVAFIIAVSVSFLLYFGFDGLAGIFTGTDIAKFGMRAHYQSMARGVLRLSDIVYFIGLGLIFLSGTVLQLGERRTGFKRKDYGYIPKIAIPILIFLLGVMNVPAKRFDLTQDQRYTLSEAAKQTIAEVDSPLVVDILLEGNFPPEFRRLQQEVRQLLQEFGAYNSNLKFNFIDPLEDSEDREAMQVQMREFGLTAAQVEVQESGKISTELVYPWALAFYNDKTVKIPLLKNQLGSTSEERINNSIQNLEYAFADGFSKLTRPKSRKVAVLKGNGELDDRFIADFFGTLREYYFIAPFTLDSAAVAPGRTLKELQDFDLIVAAAPTEAFSDNEKYILDQYIMNGGASLWLVDASENRLDTLTGNTFAFGKDLNLNDFFFKYGVRINQNLVKDIYAAPIVLASGSERESQYNRYPWFYNPLSSSANNHPIVTNIEAVKFEYASAIDTLPNGIDKTILLSTSPISRIVGLPSEINIDKEIPENLKVINEGPDPSKYNSGEVPLAVLLEGEFASVFTNRIKPFSNTEDKTVSVPTKMVIISDGDVIRNQLDRGRPLELGFDKWTQSFYGNKEFLLNTVNYLLDDSGLINIRTKEIAIPFMDPQRTADERTKWQALNLLLPLALLAVFGLLFNYIRKRKYGRQG